MNLQLFTKWYAKYVLLALCCVLLLVVPLMKGPYVGSEPFLFLRLAENPSFFDDLSSGGRFAAYSWGTVLALFIAPEIFIQVLPFILGLLSFFVFKKILEKYSQNQVFVNLSLLLFILSPGFLYIFSFINSLFIAFFLSLLTFYFFMDKKKKWFCVPIILLLPVFNLAMTLILLVILFLYSLFLKKERRKFFLLIFLFGLISSSIYYGYIIYHTGLPHEITIVQETSFLLFQKIFFDLGSIYGIGLFLFLLFITGLAFVWDRKYSNLFIFSSISFLFLLSSVFEESLLFFSLFIVMFAAKGFIELSEFRWKSKQYRNLILLILISGVVFSSISQLNELVNSSPDQEILDGLSFLSTQKQGVVFSDYTRGVWINSAGQKNVLDENYEFVPDAEERYEDSLALYYYRDSENSTRVFEKYNVSYVWIDEEMQENIWEYDTEGLLFILQYTKRYKEIYNKEGVRIWRIEE